jgi:hypothetical protein
MGDIYFERNAGARKVHILVGTAGLNMNLVLFCNLNVAEVYTNLKNAIHQLNFMSDKFI